MHFFGTLLNTFIKSNQNSFLQKKIENLKKKEKEKFLN